MESISGVLPIWSASHLLVDIPGSTGPVRAVVGLERSNNEGTKAVGGMYQGVMDPIPLFQASMLLSFFGLSPAKQLVQVQEDPSRARDL